VHSELSEGRYDLTDLGRTVIDEGDRND